MAVDLQPTEAMAAEAERGLAWREEFGRGGTEVGVARARDIKNRKNLSPDTVRRMKSYFARHEVDKQGEGFSPGEDGYPSAGRIAWALWGGDPGQAWANRKSEQLDNEAEGMAAAKSWYAIQQTEDGSPAEIHLYDEIGGYGVGAKQFIADLKRHSGSRLHLRINSVGGSVTEGLAIANAIKRHKGGVTAHVDGLAASMATVIAVSADETVMSDNAIFMIHEPWSVGQGTADDLRAEAEVLDKMKKSLVRAYTRKTGLEDEEVEQMMKAETWMNAEEALASGFIDYIEDGLEAAASVTPELARARFDNFQNSMRKTAKTPKATEAAPEVVEPAAGVTDAPVAEAAVDNSAEVMNAELQAKVDALQAELNAKLEAEAAVAQASEDLAKELESLKAEVERLTAESASKDEQINDLLAASKSAGEQAAAIVASVGLEPVAVVPAAEELTAAQKFAALEGPEATEFYRANKAAILKTFYS